MISRSRLCKEGIAAVSIIEITRINNDSSDAVSMTADPLGCRVQYNIGSVLDRSRDGARSTECIVNDQSHTMLLCHSRNRFEIRDIAPWISDTFQIDRFCMSSMAASISSARSSLPTNLTSIPNRGKET